MISIGVIGVGIMGAGHVRTITEAVPGAEVTAIYDADEDRARAIASDWRLSVDVRPPDELIEVVDAVIIASPDATHVELALSCIEARLPVLVEKPLATDIADARRVVDAEAAAGRHLVSVGFMRRFDPGHTALRDAIGEDGIGRPTLFRSIHRNQLRPDPPSAWRTVVSSGIHDIDSARWILGEFVEVGALGIDGLGDGAVDLVHIHGRHESGAISVLEVNASAGYGYEVAAELVGTLGTVSSIDPTPATHRRENVRGPRVPENWMPRFADAYRIELRAWIDSVVWGVPWPGATALDGYRDQVVAGAVLEALDQGRPVAVDVGTD